jgi:Acetyltransferase (GNAT) domain
MTESAGGPDAALIELERGPFELPRADRFEEWLRAPAPLESTHPRFDIRRAREADFDAIYDLVDQGFGIVRPHAQYDWLYRRNPYGRARCWIVIERAGGRLVGSTVSWPWPLARGGRAIEGALDGDLVTAPGWQHQGISGLRVKTLDSHSWQTKTVALSWPNEKSRAEGIKRGRGHRILGPVPRSLLMLNTNAYLVGRGWSAPLGAIGGAIADAAVRLWRATFLRTLSGLVAEEVRRFDSSFDAITQRCMAWHGFWSPHAAAFLNWRYFDRPAGQYVAFSLAAGAERVGYYVLKTESRVSWLMEFVAPTAPRRIVGALLLHAIKTAREAGCAELRFSQSGAWHHWSLFRRAGFIMPRSTIYLWPAGNSAGVADLSMWQWVPGDMDWL